MKASPRPPPGAPTGTDPRPGRTGGARRWWFRLIALTVVPVLVLGVLEGLLRVIGYGHPTGFFRRVNVGGKEILVNNEQFSVRFFPPMLARWPTPIRMEVNKPADTYRIFILGESAAQGDPEPAFGAGRYLEVLLNERFPGEHFEVVNTSITAINSNVILPIARDCARQSADLWIVYVGNNEMVGPFGAATVFGAKAPPRWAIRLSLAVEQTRVGQLLQSMIRRLKGRRAEPSWGGMQMFLGNQLGPDDPRRAVVDRNFLANLEAIVRAGLDSGARVVLSTVAVNLRDCPPFASWKDPGLSVTDRAAFDRWFDAGRQAQQGGDFAGAAEAFAQASKLDPAMAELQFCRAETLLHLTNVSAAADDFQLACDDDALPFRADSRINHAIREVARRLAGPDLTLLEVPAALTAEGGPAIPGEETFYEHVHFNFDGNYRLARAWADRVQRLLPPAVASRSTPDWAKQELCERRLALTDWNRVLVLKSVLERLQAPPFTAQSNNARQRQAVEAWIARLSRGLTPDAMPAARDIYLQAMQRSPGDHFLHENFAGFLEVIGDYRQAAAQWEQVQEMLPQDCVAYFQRGHLLERQGQWAEARASLARAVAIRPSLVQGWYELGNVCFAEGDYGAAVEHYERARRLRPNNPQVYCDLGRALSLLKRSGEAVRSFQEAIRLNPGFWEAHYALGGQFGMEDRVREAQREFEEVIRLKPDYAPAHLNLGVALMKAGQLEEAAREYQETLRLEPANRTAREYLEKARAQMERGRQSMRPATPGKAAP